MGRKIARWAERVDPENNLYFVTTSPFARARSTGRLYVASGDTNKTLEVDPFLQVHFSPTATYSNSRSEFVLVFVGYFSSI